MARSCAGYGLELSWVWLGAGAKGQDWAYLWELRWVLNWERSAVSINEIDSLGMRAWVCIP